MGGAPSQKHDYRFAHGWTVDLAIGATQRDHVLSAIILVSPSPSADLGRERPPTVLKTELVPID